MVVSGRQCAVLLQAFIHKWQHMCFCVVFLFFFFLHQTASSLQFDTVCSGQTRYALRVPEAHHELESLNTAIVNINDIFHAFQFMLS